MHSIVRQKPFVAITQQPLARFQRNFARESSLSENFRNGTDTRLPQNVNVCFPEQFGGRRAAAFVSSPRHLLQL